MPLLLLAAAATFACSNPSHHDGDAIRCAGEGKAMRLYGIDAPEMPGACRPGRDCTPGDPYAAREQLAALTRGRSVTCEQVDTDHYGRRIVRCSANGVDLGCSMVASGRAVERYGDLGCADTNRTTTAPEYALADAPRPGRVDALRAPTRVIAEPGTKLPYTPTEIHPVPRLPWPAIAVWLLLINSAAYALFAIDKRRATAGRFRPARRIPESTLLVVAALGGSIGALTARQRLPHKSSKQPFGTRLLLIAGVQVGLVLGVAALILLPAA